MDAKNINWTFKPKNLLAALSVNRLFNATLTPLLWEVYNELAFNNQGFSEDAYPHYIVTLATLNAHFHHIRYLELEHDGPPAHMFQQHTMFKFHNTCTKLRELKLSQYVDLGWAAQLIMANPNLTVLHWGYSNASMAKGYSQPLSQDLEGYRDLKYMFGLRRLRVLRLEGWQLNTLHMCHILGNNAETLQELDLQNDCCLMDEQIVSTSNDGLAKSALLKMDKQEVANAGEWIPAGRPPFFLPRLTTLCIKLKRVWAQHHLIYHLVRAVPLLEAIVIHSTSEWTSMELGLALRQHCPRLNSVQNPNSLNWNYSALPLDERLEVTVNWIDICAPRNMIHLSMIIPELEVTITTALLNHVHQLESLDLTACSMLPEAFENLAKVLAGCKRLKRFSWNNYDLQWDVEHVPAILESLAGCSQILETLSLSGFSSLDENGDVIDEEEYIDGDNDVGIPLGWIHLAKPKYIYSFGSCRRINELTLQWIQDKPRMKYLLANKETFKKVSSCP
ncbi:hypothetical protein BGZ95_005093 [Linnemannia exigua]|uniref:Uncharacterized protein n=1 Tax=Linnemannia exigua TaxID=604196 RepID=A0AAD4H0G2_9FUNG|nr:hypothetical protein BGZ95_005093 [Linnemannia exigua]